MTPSKNPRPRPLRIAPTRAAVPPARRELRFRSGHVDCVAWHYPGTNGACVVMAGGFAVPKEPATDQFARLFNEAGYTVLAFDYRRLGESGGTPRLRLSAGMMVADWNAAIDAAADLPEVDSTRIGAWAFSASGGVLLEVAARRHDLAAVVAQTPNANGPAAMRNATRSQTFSANIRFTVRAALDGLGKALSRPPLLVPLVGTRGHVAMLTTPDAADTPRALNADHYPDWEQRVSAWSAMRIGLYRPGRLAPQISTPVLVLVCDQDRSSLAAPAIATGSRIPLGVVVTLPGGHYAPFLEQHAQAADLELDFLARHLGPTTDNHDACADPA